MLTLFLPARNAAERAKESEAMATTRDVPFDDRAQANGELKIQLEIARLEKELEMVKVSGVAPLYVLWRLTVRPPIRPRASCANSAPAR